MVDKTDLKKITKILPVIGIILFGYLIYSVGLNKIGTAFLMIPPHYFIFAFLLFIPRMLLFAYKWQFISKKQKMDFDLLYLAKVSLISLFYGSVTPGAIGWHIRIYYFKKKTEASLEKCIANSLIDTTSGFLVGLFLALIGSIFLIEYFPGLFPVLLMFFIFYAAVFVLFMKKERGRKIFNIFIRPFIPSKYKELVDQSVDSLYEDLPRVRDMVIPFSTEILTWIIGATQAFIIALAFSIDIPFFTFILISITSVVVASALPISIGGLGIREGALVVLLSSFGVQAETAFVISLGGYLVKTVFPGILGWVISLKSTNDEHV